MAQSSSDHPVPLNRSKSMGAQPPRKHFLRTSPFVVLGEGLAAGMGSFSLSSDTQMTCFPAQMARQMEVSFVQRLIQPPGIGYPAGFLPRSVVVPSPLQSTVVEQLETGPVGNLSVPN